METKRATGSKTRMASAPGIGRQVWASMVRSSQPDRPAGMTSQARDPQEIGFFPLAVDYTPPPGWAIIALPSTT